MMSQYLLDTQGKRQVLAQRNAVFIDQGQAIGIGILREANIAVVLFYTCTEGAETRRRRFRFTLEHAGRFPVHDRYFAAELLKEGGRVQGPRTVACIECNLEFRRANRLHVDVLQDRSFVSPKRIR